MSFKTEIEAIVGDIDSPDYNTQAGLYLVEGVKFITKSLMDIPSLMNRLTQSSTLNNSPTTISTANMLKVVSITRNDGSRDRKASEIQPEDAGDYTDVNSIYYTSKLDPKYYISNGTLNVLPTPANGQSALVKHITPDTSVATSESSISNFPAELERGVILYASKELLRLFLNTKNATLVALGLDSVSAPSAISLDTVTYTDATAGDASIGTVSSVSVGSVDAANVTTGNSAISALPTYSKVALSPDYTGPGALGVDDYLTGEDVELAQVALEKHTQSLQKQSNDIQDELNEFNKELSIYQIEVQEELQKQNVELERARTNATIAAQKAQQDAASTTDVNKINKNKDLQISLEARAKDMESLVQNNNAKIADYQIDVESYSQQVNRAVQAYQASFQEVVQDYNWYAQQYQIATQDLITFLSQYIKLQEVPSEVTTDDRAS